ncbi:hypothetical protein [Photobacterium damselae]|uniref:hypothetical protein n=1 Tax=Photobacterium damselae TaxID=38293 RepID=UPI003B67F2CA
MGLEQQISSLVQASENLTGAVNNKIGEIDSTVQRAVNEFNEKVNEVITSIPENHTDIYVNNENGNDNNTGLSRASKLQTLDKALAIASKKRSATIHLGRVTDCQNNPYYVYDKHKYNGLQVTIFADVGDGYTESPGSGSSLEAEQHRVPLIVFTHKTGRNYLGSINMDDGRLSFGGYRLNVNIEWKITNGASITYDGNAAIIGNDKAYVNSYRGNKIILNADTSGAYYVNVGMFEFTGTVRLALNQGVTDKSTALNNRLLGYWNSSYLKGTRLFIEGFNSNRTIEQLIFGYSSFKSVPFTQIAQL